jgi:putative polyketide hydroxylase
VVLGGARRRQVAGGGSSRGARVELLLGRLETKLRIRLGVGVADLSAADRARRRLLVRRTGGRGFRAGNTFLVGDAAHCATPRGGTGLNTAIQDGYDLGWNLAWVLLGWADGNLLDSYEGERRPVAEHHVERFADRREGPARRAGSCARTSAVGSPTPGWRARATRPRRSTCLVPG